MTAAEILKEAVEKLKLSGIATPQLDAEVILSHLLGVERVRLHIYPEMEISQEICQSFWRDVEKRLNKMPVQYIIKQQEFMGLDFFVEEGVLIPRGDTEILVEKVLDLYQHHYCHQAVEILDIGVGSGAITVALGKYIEKSRLYGVDISLKALEIATKNAERHGIKEKITFLHGSLFEALKGKDLEGTFDFVVSNPPYIPRQTITSLSREVKDYEPLLALDGGEDGLDFYRRILEKASVFLKTDGWLVFEFGYDQGHHLMDMMGKVGYHQVEIIKDLAGLDRVVVGRR